MGGGVSEIGGSSFIGGEDLKNATEEALRKVESRKGRRR